jgi:hypothetical protein
MDMYDWYWRNNAAQYGYDVLQWMPDWKKCIDAFTDPNRKNIESLRQEFVTCVYDEKDLTKHDEYIKSVMIPDLVRFAESFGGIMERQGVIIPAVCAIYSAYGNGGSYDPEAGNEGMTLRVSGITEPARITRVAKHEFAHILIENPIIQKYNIPHNMKEAIVDIICELYFGKRVQKFAILPFVRKYINKNAIENDLTGAAVKMLDGYNAMMRANENMAAEK